MEHFVDVNNTYYLVTGGGKILLTIDFDATNASELVIKTNHEIFHGTLDTLEDKLEVKED